MNDAIIIKELDSLIQEGNRLTTHLIDDYHEIRNQQFYQIATRWKGRALNLLKIRFGKNSEVYIDYCREIIRNVNHSEYNHQNVAQATAVLEYAYDILIKGLTEDLFYKRDLLIFSDLFKQAEELLKQNQKLMSAVYGRIILELTIREFAKKKNSYEEVKFDQLIIKLRQNGKIHEPFENSLRANYKIGSWAVHGDKEFEKISESEIKEFLSFIRDKVLTLE